MKYVPTTIVTVTRETLTQALQESRRLRRAYVTVIRNHLPLATQPVTDDAGLDQLHELMSGSAGVIQTFSTWEKNLQDAISHADDREYLDNWVRDNIDQVSAYLHIFTPEIQQVLLRDAAMTTGQQQATLVGDREQTASA